MFTFKRTGGYNKVKVECLDEEASWPEIMDEFQKFLSGCGYIFAEEFSMRDVLEDAHDEALMKQLRKKQLGDEHEWVE
jgi:hypothetical protein